MSIASPLYSYAHARFEYRMRTCLCNKCMLNQWDFFQWDFLHSEMVTVLTKRRKKI